MVCAPSEDSDQRTDKITNACNSQVVIEWALSLSLSLSLSLCYMKLHVSWLYSLDLFSGKHVEILPDFFQFPPYLSS